MPAAALWQVVRKKMDFLLIAGVACVYLTGYAIYTRDVDYSLPSYDACIDEKPADSPTTTKFSELDAVRTASDKLLASIDAMPNLKSAGGLPELHIALRKYKEAGMDELYDMVQQFMRLRLPDVFRADDQVRNQVREIMFLWAGAENIDANSRGKFIDARELAFMEKMNDDPFQQDGSYANPAPVQAGALRDGFNKAWNGYYAELLRQAGGKELFVPPAADAKPDSWTIDPAALDKLSKQAAAVPAGEQRARYWTNVVRMFTPSFSGITSFETSPNGVALDKAIRTSAFGLTLADVEARILSNPALRGGHYTDRQGRPIGFSVSYLPGKVRHICYGYIPDYAHPAQKTP